jgi:hypothetical protein
LTAVIAGMGQVLQPPEFKTKLKEVFDHDYNTEEIKEALSEVLNLVGQVSAQPLDNPEEVFAFPDQYYEGL